MTQSNNNDNRPMQSTTTTPPTIEEAFELIEKGVALERDKQQYWQAATAFAQARDILNRLASARQQSNKKKGGKAHGTASNVENNSSRHLDQQSQSQADQPDDQDKILQLYQQQAREYLFRSREALIEALKKETKNDRENNNSNSKESINTTQDQSIQSPLYYESLDNNDATERLDLFAQLFANQVLFKQLISASSSSTQLKGEANNGTSDPNSDITKQQGSLEERLMQLNENLPKGFKTSAQRMRDLNRGLNRLGLSLYSSSSTDNENRPIQVWKEGPAKSTEQQVADIIAQAKDEVAVAQLTSAITKTDGNPELKSSEASEVDPAVALASRKKIVGDVSADSDSDTESESSNDEDNVVADEKELSLQAIQDLQEIVAEAQAKLAELNAMLDLDNDADAAIQIDAGAGKKALKDARVLLQRVSQQWKQAEAEDK